MRMVFETRQFCVRNLAIPPLSFESLGQVPKLSEAQLVFFTFKRGIFGRGLNGIINLLGVMG